MQTLSDFCTVKIRARIDGRTEIAMPTHKNPDISGQKPDGSRGQEPAAAAVGEAPKNCRSGFRPRTPRVVDTAILF